MTMRHKQSYTAQPARKLIRCAMEEGNVSKREEGHGKIKPQHLHCHSELHALNYKRLFTLINFTPCEVPNGFTGGTHEQGCQVF